jgi:tetratricopeptide (TPR) repeat protein
MLRSRPFRRRSLSRRRPTPSSPGSPPPRPLLPPGVRRILARANSLLANGQFAEAARVFERLSEEAEERGMFIRAADLALQASRAHFAADDVEAALERARRAMRLLIRGGRAGRVPHVLSKMVAVLREKGYDAQADQLEQEASQALKEVGLSLDEARQHVPPVSDQSEPKRGTLPAHCHGCGAPLVPDEVEWHDAHTVECLYCGTIVKAT